MLRKVAGDVYQIHHITFVDEGGFIHEGEIIAQKRQKYRRSPVIQDESKRINIIRC